MGIFSRRRTHEDFSAELQAHLDLETDRLIAEGMTAGEARAGAQRAFGSVARVKERFYETSGALLGAAGTFAVLTMLNSVIQLAAISMVDVGAFGAGLTLVFAATVIAAYQPARSATRVDPAETLRADA